MKMIKVTNEETGTYVYINADKIIEMQREVKLKSNGFDENGKEVKAEKICTLIRVNEKIAMPAWGVVLSILFGVIWIFVYRAAVGSKKYIVEESIDEILEQMNS